MYRIAWKSRISEAEGHGEYIFLTRLDAEERCVELDEDWPSIDHWVEEEAQS